MSLLLISTSSSPSSYPPISCPGPAILLILLTTFMPILCQLALCSVTKYAIIKRKLQPVAAIQAPSTGCAEKAGILKQSVEMAPGKIAPWMRMWYRRTLFWMPRPRRKPLSMARIESRNTLNAKRWYTEMKVSCMFMSWVILSMKRPMKIWRPRHSKIEIRTWKMSTEL